MKLPHVATLAAQVLGEVRDRRQVVWIRGPMGSGRTILARDLAGQLDATYVQLLAPWESDVDASFLLAASAGLEPADRRELFGLSRSERSSSLGRLLAERDQHVVVRVSDAWASAVDPVTDDGGLHDVCANLARFSARAGANATWVADNAVRPSTLGVAPDAKHQLDEHEVPLDPTDFAELAARAEELLGAGGASHCASPIVWRAAVGALALEAPLGRVSAACRRTVPIQALRDLAPLISQGLVGEDRWAARRFFSVRHRLPSAALEHVVKGASPEREALYRVCLGYPSSDDGWINIADALHRQLRLSGWNLPGGSAGAALEPFHAQLADTYEGMDGAASPMGLDAPETTAWIEKVFHLGRGGDATAERWSQQEKPDPGYFHDRARWRSRALKDFNGAAAIYEECLQQFPADDYAVHYRAYNLLKTGNLTRTEASVEYRRSVDLNRSHPWWWGRHISNLVRMRDYVAAKLAWQEGLRALDADGSRAAAGERGLVSNFYLRVATAWIEERVWYEARKVLDALPRDCDMEFHGASRQSGLANVERTKIEMHTQWEATLDDQSGEVWRAARSLWRVAEQSYSNLPPPLADLEGGELCLEWPTPGVALEIVIGVDAHSVTWTAVDHLRPARSDEGEFQLGARGGLPTPLNLWLERIDRA